jgi:hypothetical protein
LCEPFTYERYYKTIFKAVALTSHLKRYVLHTEIIHLFAFWVAFYLVN